MQNYYVSVSACNYSWRKAELEKKKLIAILCDLDSVEVRSAMLL